MRIFAVVPQVGGSNDSGVDDIVCYFDCYFFGNFREKASIVCSLYSADKVQQESRAVATCMQGNRTRPL